MQVSVHSVRAQCPRCGKDDFESSTGERLPLASDALMRCLACGASTGYVELIVQIAETVRARSAAMLEEMQRKRKK
jgi:uncharacterized Zn finger protein